VVIVATAGARSERAPRYSEVWPWSAKFRYGQDPPADVVAVAGVLQRSEKKEADITTYRARC